MRRNVIQYALSSGTPKTTYGTSCGQHPFVLSSSRNTHEIDQQSCAFAGALRVGPHMAMVHKRCVATLLCVRRRLRRLRGSRAATHIGRGAFWERAHDFCMPAVGAAAADTRRNISEAHRTCVVLAGTRLCVCVHVIFLGNTHVTHAYTHKHTHTHPSHSQTIDRYIFGFHAVHSFAQVCRLD